MARKADRLTLIEDARLSDRARVLGLWLEAVAGDWREVSADDFARVLHGAPSADSVGRALRELAVHGYVERRHGGRGNADSFRFRSAPGADVTDVTSPPDADVTDVTSAPSGGLIVTETFRSAPHAELSVPDTCARGHVMTERPDDRMDGEEPPCSPPLGDRAAAAIEQHADKLAGCRGSLTDYIAARVPTGRQWAYVQAVVTWLDDGDPSVWRLNRGGWLEAGKRHGVLAAALNELAATDETPMKWPAGDVRNLKTKLSILINPVERRRHERSERADGGAGAAREARRSPPKGGGGEAGGARPAADQSSRRRSGFGGGEAAA